MIDTVWSQSYNNWLNVEWCRKFVTAICQSYGLNLLVFWQCIGRPYTVHPPAQSICCHTCPKYVVQPICGLVKPSFENKEKRPLQRMSMFSILYFWTLMFFRLLHPRPVLAHLSTIQHSTSARLNDVPFVFLEENMGTHLHCFCICVQNFSPGYVGKQLCNQT